MTSLEHELLVRVDRVTGESLGRQIQREIRDAIRQGSLRANTRLPSTRSLAAQLGVSRPIVQDAYEQLAAEGYLQTRRGARPVVPEAATGNMAASEAPARRTVPIRYDLRPAIPDLSMFPRKAWLKMLRRAVEDMPASAFGYGDRHGTPALRHALAEYLGRVRGVIADPERIIITSGFAEARALACSMFAALGVRRLGVEDPGYSEWKSEERAGIVPVSVPVDAEGMALDELDALKVQAVLVTPAHQFPTGVVLSTARRRQLVEWLKANDAFALEDDYDAEYRYDHQPIGALQGLTPERILYAGTVSKTLAPALRLGWLVVPANLVDAVKAEQRCWNEGCPRLDQNALAAFIETGEYDRHLRRMRSVYRSRRAVLLNAIEEFLPGTEPQGIAAGLHVTLNLPDTIDATSVCAAAALRGIAIEPLEKYRRVGGGASGLLLGYGAASENSLRAAMRMIAESAAYPLSRSLKRLSR